MPEKKPKEAPPIVEGVSPADGSKAAARLFAVPTEKTAVMATALKDDTSDWRGTCAICFDLHPLEDNQRTFYACCCKTICTACCVKCRQYDTRCPLCRTPGHTSDAELLSRLQKHVDKGNAEAQFVLGSKYRAGALGLQQNFKLAIVFFERAAAQGNAKAQNCLASCYSRGQGVEIDLKTAALWNRRAAEQGLPVAQCNLGIMFHDGEGVAQSYDEAARWFGLAAAQGHAGALYSLGVCHANGRGVAQSYDEAVKWYRLAATHGHANAFFGLGVCHANGQGVPQDRGEALRLFKRAAVKGHAGAAAAVEKLLASLAT